MGYRVRTGIPLTPKSATICWTPFAEEVYTEWFIVALFAWLLAHRSNAQFISLEKNRGNEG